MESNKLDDCLFEFVISRYMKCDKINIWKNYSLKF